MLPGQVAGSVDAVDGYRHIKINHKLYLAHRLAWLYVYGEFPIEQLDHINRCEDDNRIGNLRSASSSQNQCNKSMYKNNRSGYKGVSFYKPLGLWVAKIMMNGKQKHLGYFSNIHDASHAYQYASNLHNSSFRSNIF